MAATKYAATMSQIQTGTAVKTLLELKAPATARLTVYKWWCEFRGISGTQEPILLELVRTDYAATATSLTPTKIDDYAPTALATAAHTATAEGTPGTSAVLEQHYIHPQSGLYVPESLGREIVLAASTNLRIRVTSVVDTKAVVGFCWEE